MAQPSSAWDMTQPDGPIKASAPAAPSMDKVVAILILGRVAPKDEKAMPELVAGSQFRLSPVRGFLGGGMADGMVAVGGDAGVRNELAWIKSKTRKELGTGQKIEGTQK